MPVVSNISLLVFVVVMLAELLVSTIDNRHLYNTKDALYNITMGIIMVLSGFFFKAVGLMFFIWLYRFRLFDLNASAVTTWVGAILACDLVYYLFHWVGHRFRIFWASHSVHHSSDYFNYSVAVRNHFIHLSYRFFFWAPLCLAGFDPYVIIFIDNCTNLYQFLLHTRLIGKLGPLEWILNTPSHHRVHHGSNEKYIDKNFGGLFIFYDKLFGTFCREMEDPVFGITKNRPEGSVLRVIFSEFICIGKELNHAKSFKSKLKILFSDPSK